MADASRPLGRAEPAPETPRGGLSLGKQLLRPRTILAFLVPVAILVFVFVRQDIPISQVWAEMRGADPALYLLGALAYYASFLVRTLRWKQLLANAGYDREAGVPVPGTAGLLRIIVLSWFANSVLPAKLGDGYRGYLLKRAANVSFSKTMGTVLAERIADFAMLVCLLLLSGFLAFRDRLPPGVGLLMAIGAAISAASILFLFSLRSLRPLITRVLPARLHALYDRLEEGLLLAFRRRLGYIGLLTVAVWLAESTRFMFVAASLGVELPLALVVFVALCASLLTTVPFTPAGLGLVEGGVTAALVLAGQDRVRASSVALLDRTITFWSLLLVGALVYAATEAGRRPATPVPSESVG